MSGPANSILISPADGDLIVKEAAADAGITPGHLIERTATGIKVHATAQGRNQRAIALENVANAGGIDDAYIATETARFAYFRSGDVAFMLVKDGTAAIALNADLASSGDGTVVTVTDTVDAKPLDEVVVGKALEAVDNSGGGAPVRIKVEIA